MSATPKSPASDATPASISRLPSLDGWRAVSIAMVLGAHSQFTPNFPPHLASAWNVLFPAQLGVHFFFVISGFLITWLMIVEDETHGRVCLKHFYARRALRILPVCFAFLATLGVLQAFGIYTQGASVWIHNLTFTTNFLDSRPFTTGHLWSLGVEEQFYLFWPPLFVMCGVARSLRNSAIVLSIPIILSPIFRFIYDDPYYGFLPHMDGLAAGCIGAVLLRRKTGFLRQSLEQNARLVAFFGIVLIVAPVLLRRVPTIDVFFLYFGRTFQGCGFTVLLLQSIFLPHKGGYRFLNVAWVRQIGVLSFSLYIWQEIFCSPSGSFSFDNNVWWLFTPWWLIPVFLTATLSYYGLERPLFRFRARFRHAK